jgi:hypothetical protein
MADDTPDHDDDAARRRLKRVAVQVIAVQIITLALLWLFQTRFSSG